ncbi:host alc inhibitory protein [Serratia phage Muldoon]|uniref:Host alc inhibitory protein n=1 Tax=Serratia phage Muldoon TaxID=2601678 RepID=A0A5P8PHI9_9CAUD|nr:inhibitor of host transcription [Serratia phage Muldoon]QFR56176.1 host alc inhibitory protein [Serratia phage Muldoon]
MNLQLITNQMILDTFAPGGSEDGIYAYNEKGKNLGFLSDLRIALARKDKAYRVAQERRQRENQERDEKMPQAVDDMIAFLENNLTKIDATVFKNITQPNVHACGHKFYLIVDPLHGNHRLGIMHATKYHADLVLDFEGYKIQGKDMGTKHILINGLSQDEIVEIILKVCQ